MSPNEQSTFVALLLITLLALAVPVISSRMRVVRLPIVVGEILAGMLIGRSGKDLVQSSATLRFLADFGFTFLMFLSGLEVSFESLSSPAQGGQPPPAWQRPVQLSVIYSLLTCLIAFLAGYGLAGAGLARNPVVMGLVLSTTSLGIVVPVLKEHEQTTTTYGQTLLISALISDFATLLLLSLAIAVARKGLSLNLFLFLLLFGFFVVATRIGHLESHYLDGKPLRRQRLPGDALIMGIQRQGEVLVPHGDTVVHRGDILMLVGRPDSLREARHWLGEEEG